MAILHVLEDAAPGDDGGWEGGGDDTGAGDDGPGDHLPDDDLPREEAPSDDTGPRNEWHMPGRENADSSSSESNSPVASLTMSVREERNDPGFEKAWGTSLADRGGTDPAQSPHSRASTISDTSTTAGPPALQQRSMFDNARFTMGPSFGAGAGFAFFVGPTATGQVGTTIRTRDTDAGVSGFFGAVGMGGFLSTPGYGFSVNYRHNPPVSHVGTTTVGCARAVLLVVPLVSLQVSETEFGSGIVNDVSLSLGTIIGVGAFGGVSCQGTLRSPTR